MNEPDTKASPSFAQSTPEGRFVSLGPYYAMFPVDFVAEAMERFCPEGAAVLDPFCGRGTVPFVAAATGHQAYGFDINPVACVYAATKAAPAPLQDVLARLVEVGSKATPAGREPENDFQALCWSPRVLAFLRAARAELRWRDDAVDRTLMACILVVLHAKVGNGLSNQIRQSKAMSPDYSVRWWREKGMTPPDLDPVEFLASRIRWRYAKGLPDLGGRARVVEGDSAAEIARAAMPPVRFVLTSPPYCGVTNYRYDNWIRLWMLGDTPLPTSQGKTLKYESERRYATMMRDVFGAVREVCAPDAVIVVRTDRRKFTLETTRSVLADLWPEHDMLAKHEMQRRTQTALFTPEHKKVGEVDIVLSPKSLDLSHRTKGYEKVSEILERRYEFDHAA